MLYEVITHLWEKSGQRDAIAALDDRVLSAGSLVIWILITCRSTAVIFPFCSVEHVRLHLLWDDDGTPLCDVPFYSAVAKYHGIPGLHPGGIPVPDFAVT